MDSTIEYYDQNADPFVQETLSVDFSVVQQRFLGKLFPGARILDFGCGSGRDAKYFLDRGYLVEATDGSGELCRRAGEYAGIQVKQMLFEQLDEFERYDGIWACSSILHLDKEALREVLRRMGTALKADGVVYASFKYGDFEGLRRGRFFTDFTPESFGKYMGQVPGLQVEEWWVTGDVRPGREKERWLNLLLRKTDSHRSGKERKGLAAEPAGQKRMV
ncbi:MAG: class I SAM-dependent methyltransferase [Eubacteriales bacterium]|nr:class I SAM-dependent methyltransferase [Eubacteriales bacterium]